MSLLPILARNLYCRCAFSVLLLSIAIAASSTSSSFFSFNKTIHWIKLCTVHEIFSKGFMVPARRNLELLIIGQNWARLKAKVLAHIENDQKSSPFELYGRSDNVYETCLFSRKISNLNKSFKTQKGKPILGQKLPNIMPIQMVPCMGAYSEFHH